MHRTVPEKSKELEAIKYIGHGARKYIYVLHTDEYLSPETQPNSYANIICLANQTLNEGQLAGFVT